MKNQNVVPASFTATEIKSEMDGALRCPVCHSVPVVTVEGENDVILNCEVHTGHMAIGTGLAQAVKHWNTFIQFLIDERKAA